MDLGKDCCNLLDGMHLSGDMTRILITAGPTHEPIDDVRYLANRSSGRMGIALATAAADRGLPTTLLLGPVPETPHLPSGVTCLRFRTTDDLQALLAGSWPDHDLLLMAAAVADFRPAAPVPGKLRRRSNRLVLDLEPTPDLLSGLTRTRPDQRVVAFALEEPDGLLEAARRKLEAKGADAIVANPLETMDAETVTAVLLERDGGRYDAPPDLPKTAFADWLLDRLLAPAAGRVGDRM